MSNIVKNNFSLTPTNLDEAMKYAEMMAKSSIIPKSYQGKAGDILVAVQMGAELGLKPIQSLQNIAVINGKPSIFGDACIALIQSHPEFEDIEEFFDGEGDKLTAICVLKRKGKTPQRSTFSVEDAKKAGLWNKPGPWVQYPKRMLQMRARGFALRNGFADALLGLILVEEAQDYKEIQTSNYNSYQDDSSLESKADKLLNKLDLKEELKNEPLNLTLPHEENQDLGNSNESTDATLAEQLSLLIDEKHISFDVVKKWLDKAKVSKLSDLPHETLVKCIDYVKNKD